MAEKIDVEVGNLLTEAKKKAKSIIEGHRGRLTLLAKKLLAEETLEGQELQELLAGSTKETPVAA